MIQERKIRNEQHSVKVEGSTLGALEKGGFGWPTVLQLVRRHRKTVEKGCLARSRSIVPQIIATVALLLTINGCLATRNWVNQQISPISGRLNDTNAKADRALAGLQNLRLQQRLVLDSRDGPTFAFDSTGLTESGKRQVDGFFEDLTGSTDSGSASSRIFVIAGHTDNIGGEGYNYSLGQRRAERVAGYVINKEGVDPMQVRVVSYGASKPIADNNTAGGRQSNRRVEILVYQEVVAPGT
jgi:outer membrane protein OmpA-like peptidoglycan-associated protein